MLRGFMQNHAGSNRARWGGAGRGGGGGGWGGGGGGGWLFSVSLSKVVYLGPPQP